MTDKVVDHRVIRRKIPVSEKIRIVEASYEPGAMVSEVARRYNVGHSSLVLWRRLMQQGALVGVKSGDEVVTKAEFKQLQKEKRQLERLLGRKTLECEVLREAVKIGREKKLISHAPLPGIDDLD